MYLFKKICNGSRYLGDIHLGGTLTLIPGKTSDIRYIYLIISIGIFILLIACFNYMNMATARAYNRGREIGILKVTGSSKSDLILQFIIESVVISFGGLIVALVIVCFIIPAFNTFTERALTFKMIFGYSTMIKVMVLTIIDRTVCRNLSGSSSLTDESSASD